jgi:hypothetical protein
LFPNGGAQNEDEAENGLCDRLLVLNIDRRPVSALFRRSVYVDSVRLAAEPRNPLLLGALRLDAGLSLVFALTGLVLTVKTTQIAVTDLLFRRARQTPD